MRRFFAILILTGLMLTGFMAGITVANGPPFPPPAPIDIPADCPPNAAPFCPL